MPSFCSRIQSRTPHCIYFSRLLSLFSVTFSLSFPCFHVYLFIVCLFFDTEHRFGCLPLQKPILERQVLVFGQMADSTAGSLWRWGTLVPKPILTSQHRQRFFKEGEGKQQRDQGEGVEKFSMCRPAQPSTVHSEKDLETGQVAVWRASSWYYSLRSANLPELGCLKAGVCIF